ncbi:FkbM family methyltransferase [Simiduia agarivorans]|uniref:Methyltransferase FkbM domain-containing protein n=1 Tax=Simiduia agarivorans (strain DSM 21679 / JCM 13881 / BCRC 17597 / SA1) TaxID=1117647 RepID=K4KHT8_SIMAS|nr:FkbM family methyltransferase [Simiduia agarivorans]AFU97745.1 hypothetical protein M5M_02640 [Simiduia agarivorans SA1 = DSM 21679]
MPEGEFFQELASIVDAEENVLSQAKAYWLFGKWEELVKMSALDLLGCQDGAAISVLIGSAYFHLLDCNNGQRYFRQGLALNANKTMVARILVSGLYNSLGRISALREDRDSSKDYFKLAVDVGIRNAELVSHSRAVSELSALGLLPQASELVAGKLKEVKRGDQKSKDLQAHLLVLESEISLLNHELSLSYTKGQLYNTDSNESSSIYSLGSDECIRDLQKKSPSQLGQDLWVLERTNYKRNGYFVEFGATDGVLLSNTFLLEKEFSWSGLCSEPNPKFFSKLKSNRNCEVSDACISATTGELVEFVFADEFGGFSKYASQDGHSDKRSAYQKVNGLVEIETISLNDWLVEHNAPKNIDYMSVDTEGSEYEILSSFPFEEWNIQLITVEHNFTPRRDDIFKLLTTHGYKRVEAKFDDWYYKS